jgi:hypothetical protein
LIKVLDKNGQRMLDPANATNKYGARGHGTGRTVYGQIISAPLTAKVTTNSVSSITTTNATCGGNIISNGGTTITSFGVCWDTSPNPTIANSKTTQTGGLGNFTSNITGLSLGTTYYVRAYVTNGSGTSYGQEVNFTTLASIASSLLIPKGVYTPITTSGNFPFNPSLGGGQVGFTGESTYSSSTIWGPHSLFDNTKTSYDWCSSGPSQFGQFAFPRSVSMNKIFIVPRTQGDSFPSSVTLVVDGVTVGTYSQTSISQADGLEMNYSGTGFYIQPNVSGTTWKLVFTSTTYIGEIEFWGN